MTARTRVAAVTLLLLLAASGCASRPGGASAETKIALPFIENDFKLALTRARESNVPLFIEVWAPW
jgi:hypothetical protein